MLPARNSPCSRAAFGVMEVWTNTGSMAARAVASSAAHSFPVTSRAIHHMSSMKGTLRMIAANCPACQLVPSTLIQGATQNDMPGIQ